MSASQPPGRLLPTASAAQVLTAAKPVFPSVKGHLNGFHKGGQVVIVKCRRFGMSARQIGPGGAIDRGPVR